MKEKTLAILLCLFYLETIHAFEKIEILGLFTNKAIVKIDGKQRVLNKEKPSPEGVLLISASSNEAILEINGKQNAYTLGSRIGANFKKSSGGRTSTIAPDSAGMYRANGSINGFQVNFMVDTGATLVSMNRIVAKRIGLNYKLEGKISQSQTASGISKIYIMNLEKVAVGDIEVRNVQGAVHDNDFPVVILLGNSFLNQVNMTRDGKILQLKEKNY